MGRPLYVFVAILLLACPIWAQTIIFDNGFDPGIDHNIWLDGPWYEAQNPNPWGHHLEGNTNHHHSPTNSAQQPINYRVAYNMVHPLGGPPIQDSVYLRAWIFEDNDMPYIYPPENEPNGYFTLSNTDAVALPVPAGEDWFRIGTRGRYATSTRPQWGTHLFVETKSDGPVLLYNAQNPNPPYSWPRRQGWRKYAIEFYPYTGMAGDVKFYVDDTLVYSGYRDQDSYVDRIIMGSDVWTFETYWYDDFQLGWISAPVACASLGEAKSQPDETWVSVSDVLVSGRFTKNPFAGWMTVQESERSAGLWVTTSKEVNPGDLVNIRGRMATNNAGVRYLDAAEVVVTVQNGAPPKPFAMLGRTLDRDPSVAGMCATVWGRVTGRGQEAAGDWRRYLTVQSASLSEPIRVYYDNIISGIDPVPNPAVGDFVLVTGSVGREVIGGETIRTLWIRKAGDLVIR